MALTRLHREIKAGFPSSVYFIWSEDDFILWEAYQKIKATATANKNDIGVDIFDVSEDEFSIKSVEEALRSSGLFGSRRLVILRRFEQIQKSTLNKLLEVLESSFENTLVILSKRAPQTELQNLKKTVVIELNLKGQDAIRFVKDIAKVKGISLSESVAKILIDLTEANMGRIYWELEKLSLAGYKHVEVDVIKKLIASAVEFSAFEVARALVEQKKTDAFRPFISAREKIDPFIFIGALNWQIRDAEKKGKIDFLKAKHIYEIILSCDVNLRRAAGNYPVEIELFKLLSD